MQKRSLKMQKVHCQVTSLLTGVSSFYDLPNKGKRWGWGSWWLQGVWTFRGSTICLQWQIQGRVCAPSLSPPPLIRPDACLRLKFLHRQNCIPLFNWLIFSLMKQALHFASKLNSRDIPKCNLLILGTLLWCWQNLYNHCYLKHKRRMFQGCKLLRVEFKYTVRPANEN